MGYYKCLYGFELYISIYLSGQKKNQVHCRGRGTCGTDDYWDDSESERQMEYDTFPARRLPVISSLGSDTTGIASESVDVFFMD